MKNSKLKTIINKEYLLNYIKQSGQANHLLGIGMQVATEAGQTELTRVDDYTIIISDAYLDISVSLSTKILNNNVTVSNNLSLLLDQAIVLLVKNIQSLQESILLDMLLIYAQYLLGLAYNWRRQAFADIYEYITKVDSVETYVLKNQLMMLDYDYDLYEIVCPGTTEDDEDIYPDSYLMELYNF